MNVLCVHLKNLIVALFATLAQQRYKFQASKKQSTNCKIKADFLILTEDQMILV